jgi:hypothetical protein
MSGTSFFAPGYTPTARELKLWQQLADYEQLVEDLLTICTYLSRGSDHASTPSTGEGQCTEWPSTHHVGDDQAY